MRPGGTGLDVGVEVSVEVRVERDVPVADVDHMDLVIALILDHATRNQILNEKVIRHYQSLLVLGQSEVVRARTQSEVNHSEDFGTSAIADI